VNCKHKKNKSGD